MFDEGVQESNVVTITGKVVEECVFSHNIYGEGFYAFKISSKRLSDQYDILPITISERLVDKDSLRVDTLVKINGQLRSYNNYNNSKASRLVLTIFAREINLLQEEPEHAENTILLNGYICKNPIYRKTPFGREISDILVAVNRAYHKSDYIPCIAWGRNARYMQNLEVGAEISVQGRVQSRFYQKKVDEVVEERVAYEVSVSKIEVQGNQNTVSDKETTELEIGVD